MESRRPSINDDVIVDIIINSLKDIFKSHLFHKPLRLELECFLRTFANFMSTFEKKNLLSRFKQITEKSSLHQIAENILNIEKIVVYDSVTAIQHHLNIIAIACMRRKSNEKDDEAKHRGGLILLMMNDVFILNENKQKFIEQIELNGYFPFLCKIKKISFSLKKWITIYSEPEPKREVNAKKLVVPIDIFKTSHILLESNFDSLENVLKNLLNHRLNISFKDSEKECDFSTLKNHAKLIEYINMYMRGIIDKHWFARHFKLIEILINRPEEKSRHSYYFQNYHYTGFKNYILAFLCRRFVHYHNILKENTTLIIADLVENQEDCFQTLQTLLKNNQPNYQGVKTFLENTQKFYDAISLELIDKYAISEEDMSILWILSCINSHAHSIQKYIFESHSKNERFQTTFKDIITDNNELTIKMIRSLLIEMKISNRKDQVVYMKSVNFIIQHAPLEALTNIKDKYSVFYFVCCQYNKKYSNNFIMQLIERGININAVNEFGRTVIHSLCLNAKINTDLFKLLIELKINPCIKDMNKENCLDYLVKNLKINCTSSLAALELFIAADYVDMSPHKADEVLIKIIFKDGELDKYPEKIILCFLYNCDFNVIKKRLSKYPLKPSHEYHEMFNSLKSIYQENSSFSLKEFSIKNIISYNSLKKDNFSKENLKNIMTFLLCQNDWNKKQGLPHLKIPKYILLSIFNRCRDDIFLNRTKESITKELEKEINFSK